MISSAWVLHLLAFVREQWGGVWGKKRLPARDANNAGGATPGPEALHNPYRRFYTKTRRLEELRPAEQGWADKEADKNPDATLDKPGRLQQ